LDLKGASMEDLKKLSGRGKIPELDTIDGSNPASKYKNYVQLSAVGDGNCFLNSFSVFLTGKENDTTWALPLRVKLCLEFMTNPDTFAVGNEAEKLALLKKKLISEGFAINVSALPNNVIENGQPVKFSAKSTEEILNDKDTLKNGGVKFIPEYNES
ncbi:7069_t:CDS:2, partial [Funneliformis geosporum]